MGTAGGRERLNQKRRTRAALVAAAAELLRQGTSPSVAQVADAAQVSRATAYRYFPSQETLLAEAMLQPTVDPGIDRAIAQAAAAGGDAAARLDALVRALQAATLAHEDAFRALLRLSLAPPPAGGAADLPAPLRGARRVGWVEETLGPDVALHGAPGRRLVAALSLCIGIEALVVLRDVCGLAAEEAVEVSRWAARALLEAGLAVAAPGAHEPPRGRGVDQGCAGPGRAPSGPSTASQSGSP